MPAQLNPKLTFSVIHLLIGPYISDVSTVVGNLVGMSLGTGTLVYPQILAVAPFVVKLSNYVTAFSGNHRPTSWGRVVLLATECIF